MDSSFKKLEEVTTVDPRNKAWVVLDPRSQSGFRPLTLEDEYEEMVSLALPEAIPENVRHHFDEVRMLWLYGWFYYPFYTLARFQAAICAEGALIQRLEYVEPRDKKTPSLTKLLKEAVAAGLLADEGFGHIQRAAERRRELEGAFDTPGAGASEARAQRYVDRLIETFPRVRDMHAHPRGYWYGLPGSGHLAVELTRDLIVQLWKQTD